MDLCVSMSLLSQGEKETMERKMWVSQCLGIKNLKIKIEDMMNVLFAVCWK